MRILLICGIMMASCMDVQETWRAEPSQAQDLELLQIEIGENWVQFQCSAPIETAEVNWGNLPVAQWEIVHRGIKAELDEPLSPGRHYEVFLALVPEKGEEKVFLKSFYAPNPRLPEVSVNEILNKGSKSHPDALELLCHGPGNLAGLTVRTSAPEVGRYILDDAYIFPELEVKKGDLIILHCQPSGAAEEIDEQTSKAESGGIDSHEEAWDFWWPGAPGLSGTDGMIALLPQPDGEPITGVFYSDKHDRPGRYAGFGTKNAQEAAEYLAEYGIWFAEEISPAAAVDNRYSTSTRTLNAVPAEDGTLWFTAPTRGSSLGEVNIDYELRHVP